VEWAFRECNKGAVLIAHNSKNYDSQFVLQYLLKIGCTPDIISCGLKVFSLEHSNIKMLDSINFIPMPLR